MSVRQLTYSGLLLLGATAFGCAAGKVPTPPNEGGATGDGGSGGAPDPECADQPDGLPCGDASEDECDGRDTCQSGVCVANIAPKGAPCGELEGTECDPADTCDGKGACVDVRAAGGTPCGDPTDNDCTKPDVCDGMGVCLERNENLGHGCGDLSNNGCTNPDFCDGAGVCLDNHEPEGTACGSGLVNQCTDADTCDGMGTCLTHDLPSGTPCGNQTVTTCTAADTCDGSGTCQENHALLGTPCGSVVSTECNHPDSCDGGGLCLINLEMDGATCNDCSQGVGLCDGCEMGLCTNACIPPAKSLQTSFASNNMLHGAMFDVVALKTLVVKRLATNLNVGTHNVSIWYVLGGKTGHQTTMGDWTFVGTANGVVSAGNDVGTEIPLDLNLTITTNQRYGLYVHSVPTSGIPLRYSDGTSDGAIAVQNVDLQIYQGNGVGSGLFSTFQPSPRVFNGIVNYEIPCP